MRCVSGHQTELQRPTARNSGEVDRLRIAEGRCQRGDITLHITPTPTGEAITRYVSDISMHMQKILNSERGGHLSWQIKML